MQPAGNPNVIRFGPFEADLRTRELRKRGLKLKLQEQPFQVLAMLLERPGELVTREEIRARLWPEDTFVDFDHGLNAAVRRLREALNDNASLPRFVETLPRRGYRFIAPVQTTNPEAEPWPEAGAAKTARVESGAAVSPDANAAEDAPFETPANGGDAGPKPGRLGERARRTRVTALAWLASLVLASLLIVVGTGIWQRALRRVAAEKIVQRQLTANPSEIPLQAAAISPDGKYLAYSDAKGLHLQLIKTGQTRTLPVPNRFVASDVSWLPDGTEILASGGQAGGASGIWSFSVLGGSSRKLRGHAAAPEASPDGKLIAFLGGLESRAAYGIWVMDPNGENARRVVAAQPGERFLRVRWSPDGRRLVFTRSVPGVTPITEPRVVLGTEVLESVGRNGGEATAIVTKVGLQDFYWLPDGRILFSVAQEEKFGSDSNLWAILTDAAGKPEGQAEQVTDWAGFSFTDFSATKDGRRLTFLKLTSQDDVYVGKLEQNGTRLETPRRLTLNDRDDWPEGWTPDSKAVYFWSDRNGGWDLFEQRLDKDTAEAIPTGPEPKWYAHFSPGGAWFMYMALPKEEFPGGSVPVRIMRVSTAGGPPREVLHATGTTDFRCARAPAKLCVFDEKKGSRTVFSSFDPVKGKGREIYRERPPVARGTGRFDLSPDGSRLAISLYNPREGRIRLVSLRDGTTSDLVVKSWNRFTDIDWAPDGRGLYVGSITPEGDSVLYVDLQGHAQLLWQHGGNVATCGRPSPDGRFLAIARWTTNSNAWMIRNY